MIACPLVLYEFNQNSLYYLMFKIPRYSRLFEIDNQISEILEYYGQTKTVFDIKKMRKSLNIFEFAMQTFINLHMMTCIQIILCKQRNFEASCMGGQGVDKDYLGQQYIIAIYFVTTTLSTCGFGDIFATRGDAIEALVILLFQFVGMLFYSQTIEKVQSFMTTDVISPGDYANHMVEVVENLIVKVGR